MAFDLSYQLGEEARELGDDLRATSLLQDLSSQANPSGTQVLSAAQADYARAIAVMYEAGFYAPVISIKLDGREAADIPPISRIGTVNQATLSVTAGPRFVFGQVGLTPRAPKVDLPDGFAPGKTAQLSAIQDTVDTQIEGWRSAGHAKAELSQQQITARHPPATIDVGLRIAPGPKLRFGKLLVGKTTVRPERVRAIAGLPESAVFDPEVLEAAAQRLRRSGAFRVVSLAEAEEIRGDDILDVTAILTDQPARRFGFGAELGSTEGLTLSGFWLHRNLLGGAERLRISAEISGLGGETGTADYTLGLAFTRPATPRADTDLEFLASYEDLTEESFSSRRLALSLGFRRYQGRRQFTYGVGFETAETEDALGIRETTIVTAPLTAQFDYRDDALNPKSGYFALAEFTPFAGLDDTESGARLKIDARTYRTFGKARPVTFALRGQIGALSGPEVGQAPSDFLFFSGGGGTVRGQSYQALGITLPNGETVGGRSFLGLSAEARVPVGEVLSVVGFYDAGYIGDEPFPNGNEGTWHSGAGLGLRYDTGFGPLRLDIGVPVDGPGENTGTQFYIGLGQAF